MKTLANILFVSLFFVTCLSSQSAQTKQIQNLKSEVVEIETDYLNIKIETWDKDYIELKSDVKINLRSGNDKHDLSIENTSSGVEIISSIETDKIEKMVITTDKEGNRTYTPIDEWDENKSGNRIKNMNFGYEIDGTLTLQVPRNMDLNIRSVYGDVFIDGAYESIHTHSTYGLVEAKLKDVTNMKQVSFKSTYDIVDLTLDKRSSASLKLQTTYGSVFSNLPLESKETGKKNNHYNGCSQFSEKYVLNDGAVDIDIVATYDNIYVRSF